MPESTLHLFQSDFFESESLQIVQLWSFKTKFKVTSDSCHDIHPFESCSWTHMPVKKFIFYFRYDEEEYYKPPGVNPWQTGRYENFEVRYNREMSYSPYRVRFMGSWVTKMC